MTSSLQLARNVFLCVADGRVVFLDLRQNRYFCLSEYNSNAIIPLLSDLTDTDDKPRGAIVHGIVEALAAKGLIRSDTTIDSDSMPLCAPPLAASALTNVNCAELRIRASNWFTFLIASCAASWKIRHYSMFRTVESVRERKAASNASISNFDAMCRLVETFHRLRPYYIRKYLCLYDSLALVEYLARFKLYPLWIFGVTTEPFSAHCWVQVNDIVLNDAVQHVRQYTPIMTI